MAHKALYRIWRSQAFRELVGQQHIVQTLQNSLKEGRLSHAYLFCGPRGTGKTSAARILAKAVNCEHGPTEEPCNECSACKRITDGSVIDVLEIDAASNRGVEEIRDLRDKVKYAPTEVRQKVYIIDEVHMLTAEAFNALLKTLEEPPAHVMFILATTEPHKLPATIISRCQRFDFRRVSLEEQVGRLEFVCREEGVAIEPEASQYIARLSEGGMRDALSLLDQIISFSGNRITYAGAVSMTGGISSEQFEDMAISIRDRDIGHALQSIEALMQEGKSAERCMENLLLYFRDLLLVRMVPDSQAVTDRILDVSRFAAIAETLSQDRMFQIIDVLNHYQTEMKYSTQPQTLFEVAVMKLCSQAEAGSQAVVSGSKADRDGYAPAESANQEIEQLKQKLQQMEQQLARLMQTGVSVSQENGPAARMGSGGGSSRPSSSSPAVRKLSVKLDGYLLDKDSALFKQVQAKWTQLLAQVKERKVTVHAWLINGEPVSYHQDTVLVAFKNEMHRDTTEKPDNKQIIEQSLLDTLGHPTKLATVMLKDWSDAVAGGQTAPPEELKMEAQDPNGVKEEWINEAIKLFGEDLVKIKDD